ncbi:hypothetical protein RJT34_25537 [Clitoria ternatea]|uniref:C2H2-type domain-containing protein n=1 Tax=Clitoria ternatea TaxID=43366 RepID=A0AAN9FY11_CLITE
MNAMHFSVTSKGLPPTVTPSHPSSDSLSSPLSPSFLTLSLMTLLLLYRRPERNPLDLNNLPDEYSREGKQVLEDHNSSPGCRKKKSGGKDGKEECGKVYECRFCSLKFCKSQALGGHMNRHRQERETETLNQARQLVFRNDHNLTPQPAPHIGCCQPIGTGGYHPSGNIGDPTVPLRFPRYFSGSSSTHLPQPPPPPPPQPFLYASPSRPVSFPSSHFPHDYYVGHVMSSSSNHGHGHFVGGGGGESSSSYTCIGAPVGQGGGGKEGYAGAQHHRLDGASSINRFQDGDNGCGGNGGDNSDGGTDNDGGGDEDDNDDGDCGSSSGEEGDISSCGGDSSGGGGGGGEGDNNDDNGGSGG